MKVPNIFDAEPCTDAVEWLKSQRTLKTAWNSCTRGDWLWWALMHGGVELSQVPCVDFANDCSKRAKNYADAASAAAYAYADAAYAYADAASAAASAAAYADAYAASAAYADAAYVTYADAAAHAADAASAAASAAAYVTYADAASATERKLQADWIRKNIPYPF